MSRILIVSTDSQMVEKAEAALLDEVYDLVVASRADEALEAWIEGDEECELVLLDRTILDAEGERLLARSLSHAGAHDVPVIILGPEGPTSKWVSYLHAGASDYIHTPIDPDALAARAQVLLRAKERVDQLRAQTVIDELTGSYNRRYLDEQLAARLGEAQRYNTPFSLGLFDLDHFKQVNDTHGHQVGDVVLRETTRLVRRQLRKEDVLARYGGEEFAIMLPRTDRSGAVFLAERVRESVADSFFGGNARVRVTVSMGVASLPFDETETASQLIGTADGRLYQAKEAGRNQIIFD